MIRITAFDFEQKKEWEVPLDRVDPAAGLYYWIDMQAGEGQADLAVLRALGLNEAAAANVVGPDRDGRHDLYPDCLHLAVTECRPGDSGLARAHVDVVAGLHYLLTYRHGDAAFLTRMRQSYREDFLTFSRSPGFLLYELGDHLLESYRLGARAVSGRIAAAQDSLFGAMDEGVLRGVGRLMNEVLDLRRTVLAARELLQELATRKSPFVRESTQPHLQTLASSLARLGDDLTTERQVLSETLNLYVGLMGYQTNKVVTRLTILSMIFLPLSFLTGVYGMNLQGIPEAQWKYGYAFFWLLVASLVTAMLTWMRRRRWL